MGTNPAHQDLEIVGVVSDTRLYDARNANVYGVYVPSLQEGELANWKALVIQANRLALPELRQSVEALGHEYVMSMQTLDALSDRAILQERVTALLAGACGALALLLAGIGLYGLMSYTVTQRRKEIGIRIALGATPARVVWMVLAHGMAVTLTGGLVGVVGAALSVRLVRSLLFGVTTFDPVTLFGATALLLIVTFVACLLPAVRAVRVDPVITIWSK
jgi:ABC-type antimicrobial peptide transport system permease subunit